MSQDTEQVPSGASPETPNLEKLRDEKCVPIARAILADMVEDLVPKDANEKVDYNPILLKILKRVLEGDTNITTENPYLFQLMLTGLSGLNWAAQGASVVPTDDVRYGRIAHDVLAILSAADFRMENVTKEDTEKEFTPVREKLSELFLAERLNIMEVKYIMDNIFDAFGSVQTIFSQNVEMHIQRAEAKLFGIETMPDLTMSILDQALTNPAPNAPVPMVAGNDASPEAPRAGDEVVPKPADEVVPGTTE